MLRLKAVSGKILAILTLGMVLGVGVGLVMAAQSDSAEGAFENPVDRTLSRNHEEVTNVVVEPSAGDFRLNAEGQQVAEQTVSIREAVELLADPDAPQAQFFARVAGSNFVPRDSDMTFTYGGGGCLQRDSNVSDHWFTHDLQLPDGAVIDYIRLFFYDSNVSYDAYSELYVFDGAGGYSLIAQVDSSGTPGFGSAGVGGFSHTVDNVNESLAVLAGLPGGVGSSLRFCGIRLRYQYNPLAANFLPAVLKPTAP